jgi:hypothetical protein
MCVYLISTQGYLLLMAYHLSRLLLCYILFCEAGCIVDEGRVPFCITKIFMAKFCFGSERHYFRSNPLGSRPHLVGQNVLLVCNLFRETELFLRTSRSSSTSASQEIPHNLWNPEVHCRVYRILPLVPILSQINPFPLLMLFLEKCGLVCTIKYYSRPFCGGTEIVRRHSD